MDDNITRLDRWLSRVQLLDPPYRDSEEGKQVFQEICKLVFEEQLYASLWCESTLNQRAYLFQTEKPDEELFGRDKGKWSEVFYDGEAIYTTCLRVHAGK